MIFARIGYMARGNRTYYVKPIQEFWRAHELKLYNDQNEYIEPELLKQYKKNPKAAAESITDYTKAVSDATFRAAIIILDALKKHIATNPDTLFVVPASAGVAMEEAHALAPAYVEKDDESRKDKIKDKIKDKLEENGCNAGIGFAAIGLIALIMFARKRSK
jgi:hypothetical protein